MKKLINLLPVILLYTLFANSATAQKPVPQRSWPSVALGMPEEWYGSEESKKVADNVLLYQRDVGGWPKNTPFHKPLSEGEKAQVLEDKDKPDAIFDNGATTTEMRFLAKMYSKTGNDIYKVSFEKGLHFILEAQYKNGGWPMFFPLRKGYYTHITFNDDATFRLMNLLKDIYTKKPTFDFISDKKTTSAIKKAWDKGLGCILKTQIVVNGKPTVWCAQHDEITLLPAKARSYELPSFSGSESVGLLDLLMDIENPSPEVIRSVKGGIEWLEAHQMKNIRWDKFTNAEGKKDHRIVTDPNAGSLWARFYDLDTQLPYVCDRDGIKKSTLEEIGYERRNGYSWYSDGPRKVLDAYPKWKEKWGK
ncbi:MAG: pectate lyase [Bacteroidia bacterium]|nr:pectate lyase [Bacteroidia bacterium]